MARSRSGGHTPRPKKSLRDRIAPLDAKLDILEENERELDALWSRGGIEEDTYDRMKAILATNRRSLNRRMRLAEGLPADEPLEDLVDAPAAVNRIEDYLNRLSVLVAKLSSSKSNAIILLFIFLAYNIILV